jgi:tetratricopeptide (TPR) repeat protein
MTRALVIAALLVASSAGAVPRNTVKAHIDKATKAHAEGKFDVALEELEAAYALDPKPDLLFAIGQVYAKLDNCTAAITYYEKFAATTKDAQAKQVVTQAIDACKTKLAAAEPKPEPKPEPVSEPEPPKVEPTPAPAPQMPVRRDEPVVFAQPRSTPTGRSPWYKDPIGDALVGGGIAAGVVALVMRSGAQSEADKAVAPGASENDYRDHSDKADSKETLALVFGVAAGALVTGGIVRYVTRSKKQEATRVGIAPATSGGLITVLGRF